MSKKLNSNLHIAKRGKNDEFYTQFSDIEKELQHYRKHFEGKTVFCNCDDPAESNFVRYFALNFDFLKLKRVISTHYEVDKPSYRIEIYDKVKNFEEIGTLPKMPLKQNGDFRSDECVELLKESDIVCTNPPFSLFREYVAQLIEYDKKFLIIGNMNAVTYKETFPLIKNNLLWFGPSISSGDREFRVPENYPLSATGCRTDKEGNKYIRVKGVRWFTNLPHKKRNEELILFRDYCGYEENYPYYANYDAINVDKTKDIPRDFAGIMGVPITFLDKYNPTQFEIVDLNPHFFSIVEQGQPKPKQLSIVGRKDPYARILMRRR